MSEEKLNKLIYDIRYQTPAGITTMRPCSNGCGNSARGSGKCRLCLSKELAELVGISTASEFCAATAKVRDLVSEMTEKVANE